MSSSRNVGRHTHRTIAALDDDPKSTYAKMPWLTSSQAAWLGADLLGCWYLSVKPQQTEAMWRHSRSRIEHGALERRGKDAYRWLIRDLDPDAWWSSFHNQQTTNFA